MAASLLKEAPPLLDFSFELFTHVTRFFGFRVVLLGLFNGQKLGGKYEALVRVTKGTNLIKQLETVSLIRIIIPVFF
jgi:small subunit ribosomal protein S18b